MSSTFIEVVDDEEVLRYSLVDLMRSAGYRAEPFVSAETFLAASSLLLFNCVTTDVHVTGLGGLGLIRKLRELGNTIPVILVTAHVHRRLDDAAISVGAQCLLRKPLGDGAPARASREVPRQ